MKPQFANVFNVSVNDNRSECSLSFYHMYMQHNYTPQPKGLIDMPEKTVGEVASIMLTREGALPCVLTGLGCIRHPEPMRQIIHRS